MDLRIIRFLRRHHVLTLATTSGQASWTAHCFYAVLDDQAALVFTSDPETRHGSEMLNNPQVSGGIALETKVIGMIRGIQLTGRSFLFHPGEGRDPVTLHEGSPSDFISSPTADELMAAARNAYLKRFPFALAAKLDLWILFIDYIKMTDNRLGFGRKVVWERNP
ncbi:MAG: pyridoxamine 5'-phosphate oxidase family protein [Bacteroidales bacterium]|jgi:hypothetical protein